MSFLYPRIVTISRPNTPAESATAGVQPFQEFTLADETVIASGLAASIQFDRRGEKPKGNLPGDASKSGSWIVFISIGIANAAGLTAATSIIVRDFITDDAGVRYQVSDPYWTPLGWNIKVDRLEV